MAQHTSEECRGAGAVDGCCRDTESYAQTMRLMTLRDRPTEIPAASNMMAIGATQAIEQLGYAFQHVWHWRRSTSSPGLRSSSRIDNGAAGYRTNRRDLERLST
jgi:hypothetical protein